MPTVSLTVSGQSVGVTFLTTNSQHRKKNSEGEGAEFTQGLTSAWWQLDFGGCLPVSLVFFLNASKDFKC